MCNDCNTLEEFKNATYFYVNKNLYLEAIFSFSVNSLLVMVSFGNFIDFETNEPSPSLVFDGFTLGCFVNNSENGSYIL